MSSEHLQRYKDTLISSHTPPPPYTRNTQHAGITGDGKMTNLPVVHMSGLCNRITAVVPPPRKLSTGGLKRQALVRGLGESSGNHTLGFRGPTCTVIIL